MKLSFVIFLQICHLIIFHPPSIFSAEFSGGELEESSGDGGGCGGGSGEGLTSLTAYIGANIYWGDDGGTDNSVKIRLSGGCYHHNEAGCLHTRGVIS